MNTINNIRILAIGVRRFKFSWPAWAKITFADQRDTRYVRAEDTLSISRFIQLRRQVLRGEFDLVICGPAPRPVWRSERWFVQNLLSLIPRFTTRFSGQGVTLLPWLLRGSSVPLAGLNLLDSPPLLPRQNDWVLNRCQVYFMRELPVNVFDVFLDSNRGRREFSEVKVAPDLVRAAAKLRPISMGVQPETVPELNPAIPKTTDIFFRGRLDNSPVRNCGYQDLNVLRAEGFDVDVPEARLEPAEFFRRCAQAWLVWSPEGAGWECYRHYEVPLAGSVPIMNYPTVQRHRPLVDGEHCFLHGPEPGELGRVARTALADKTRLHRMTEAGRQHVLAHHTHERLFEHVVKTALAPASGDAPLHSWPGPK